MRKLDENLCGRVRLEVGKHNNKSRVFEKCKKIIFLFANNVYTADIQKARENNEATTCRRIKEPKG